MCIRDSDSTVISSRLDSVRKFADKHPGLRFNIGEFSATRLAGPDGDRYVQDLVETFEKERWDWNYHEYRGSVHWDAEMPVGSIDILPRDTTTPRMRMLRSYFALGTAPLAIKSLQLNGAYRQGEVVIHWELEADGPVTQIVLQRSTDGRRFAGIMHSEPSADERLIKGSYIDQDLLPTVYYYRLLTEEANGELSFSKIIALHATGASGLFIYPSATSDRLMIQAEGLPGVPVFYDLQGNRLNIPLHTAETGYVAELSSLQPGVYFIRVGLMIAKVIRL